MAQPVNLPDLRSKFQLDLQKQGFEQLRGAMTGVDRDFKTAQNSAKQFLSELNHGINQAANATAGLRAAINSSQADYLRFAGMSSQASRDWARANYEVQASINKIGEQVTKNNLPALQLQNAALKDFQALASKNPAIFAAIQGVTGALGAAQQASRAAGGGPLGGLAGGGVLAGSAAYGLYQATSGMGGIGGQIHSAMAGGATAVANAIRGVAPELANAIQNGVAGRAGAVGAVSTPDIMAGPAGGQLTQMAIQRAQQLEQVERNLSDQRMDVNLRMARQIVANELQLSRERTDAARDFTRSSIREVREFNRGITNENREFARQKAREEFEFSRQKARQDRDFNIATMRDADAFAYQQNRQAIEFGIERANIERQYQVQVRRDLEDHHLRLLDLSVTRDALGIFKENRTFALQKQRAQEDFDFQKNVANAARARQLLDEKYQYELSRKYRLEDFKRQQADQLEDQKIRQGYEAADLAWRQMREREDYAIRRGYAVEDFNNRLRDQQMQAQRQRDDMAIAYRNQVTDQNIQAGRMQREMTINYRHQIEDITRNLIDPTGKLLTGHYGYQIKALRVFIDDIRAQVQGPASQKKYETGLTDVERAYIGLPPIHGGGTGTGGVGGTGRKAAGGYVMPGNYDLGERGYEFVLRHDTTRAVERMLGGRATQEGLLSGLAAGGGGGLTVNQNYTFHGSFTEGDKQWFKEAARSQAVDVLTVAAKNIARKTV